MINTAVHPTQFGIDSTLPLEQRTPTPPTGKEKPDELRKAFDQFVGESFYGMMMKTMREGAGKSEYFHGGRAEEVFQGQLDQMLAEKMSAANASSFSDPMFELFQLSRP